MFRRILLPLSSKVPRRCSILKHDYSFTKLYGGTPKKTVIFIAARVTSVNFGGLSYTRHDRQRTCDVRARCVRVTAENQKELPVMSVYCCLSHPARRAHALYCLWPGWLCRIFPHYYVNDTNFEKKSYRTWNFFDFLYKFCVRQCLF
jgi:hypothetical protein